MTFSARDVDLKLDHRRLMAAVLHRAVRDVKETQDLPPPIVPALAKCDKEQNARNREAFYLALEVRSWFASERRGLFSFRGICNELDIDPEAVLKKIAPFLPIENELAWRRHAASPNGFRKTA